jgi:mono/diheme cytochrome c family protein
MTNQNFICKRGWLLTLFLAFLLFGCAAAPEVLHEKKTAEQAAPAGDVERGRALFMGYRHFQNDGPACMGCHSVGNNGLLGGGALGPDLTDVTTRRNPLELAATLGSSPKTLSPVMQPIYAEEPLTAAEQADLIAFFTTSVGQQESNYELVLLAISTAGFLAIVVFIQFVYRKRLRGVRRPLVDKANAAVKRGK